MSQEVYEKEIEKIISCLKNLPEQEFDSAVHEVFAFAMCLLDLCYNCSSNQDEFMNHLHNCVTLIKTFNSNEEVTMQ